MSRGMGRIEQGLFNVIRNEGRPMSYADIAGVLMQAAGINDFKERRLPTSRERSFRRALHNLVKRGTLIELNGNKSVRYFFHPADLMNNSKLAEQTNGNWEAGMAVAISTLRRIRPNGALPTSMDAQTIAKNILLAAFNELSGRRA